MLFFFNKNQEKQGNSLQQLFLCIVPRSYPPGWTVSRGKDLLWSVGNVNTLSDLRLYPDVPHVNISKYRLRLRSHVAQHTYIYYVCMPKHTCAHMAGAPDVFDVLSPLLWRLCAWPLTLWIPQRVRGFTVWLDTRPKTHSLLQRFSVSFKASMSIHRDSLTGLETLVWFHYKTQQTCTNLASVRLIHSVFSTK